VPSLYEIESDLMALVESAETVSELQREAYALELQAALANSIAKRQRVGEFLAHCEAQEEFCAAEIDRLTALRHRYSKARERVQGMVVAIILERGQDERGKWPVLEGNTVTLGIASTPPAVRIEEGAEIPAALQTVTVKMPADNWDRIVAALPDEVLGFAGDVSETRTPDRTAIKAALKAGAEIPGVSLTGGYRMVRK
jgi:hypothetical protein